MAGTLFVIATPLGNLDDGSNRMRATLGAVACIACEDTRRTAKLLARAGIERPTLSYHRFNERERAPEILDRLRAGQDIALVSDGGTPGISDPGALLVEAAWAAGLIVCPVPGPSAVSTLLSASGFPAERYVFEGFLPSRPGERRRRLRELREEVRAIVLFESPHRLVATLRDVDGIMGPRCLVLGRELTKVHETLLRGSAGELLTRLGPAVRGEVTLVLGPLAGKPELAAGDPADARPLLEAWRHALESAGGDRRRALRSVARQLGIGRAELQRRLAEVEA